MCEVNQSWRVSTKLSSISRHTFYAGVCANTMLNQCSLFMW